MRDSAFGPPAIPPEFWARPDVRRALASRDMGALFGLLRQRAGLTQMRIGTAVEIAQGRISDIILGKYHVRTTAVFTRIADGLDMPDQARTLLGLAPRPARPRTAAPSGPPRNAAAPAALGGTSRDALPGDDRTGSHRPDPAMAGRRRPGAGTSGGAPGPRRLERRRARLARRPAGPGLARPGPGQPVGRADVARVRESAKLFAQLDNRFGGAYARRPLVHYLRGDAAELLAGRYTDDVGRELFGAVAEATLLAAWTSYDCGLHGLAQRYFVQALRLAESAADRRLASSVLSAMSHQATFLGHLTEAANLARAAHAGVAAVATPVLTAQFQAMEARALAGLGDTRGCELALAATERSFGQVSPGQDPEFITYFNEAELAAEFAHCYRDLGQPARAIEHATRAMASTDGQYPRSDFFVTMVLADAYADQDDPEQACQTALGALQLGEALTSARCVAYLREFRERLDRFDGNPAVRDFQRPGRRIHPVGQSRVTT